MRRTFLQLDWILLATILLLLGSGLLALSSLSRSDGALPIDPFGRQLIFALGSLAALFFFAFFDHTSLRAYSSKLYFGTLGVLLVVLFFGTTVRGTAGWLHLGFFQVQPVEFAKLILIIFLAHFLSKKRQTLGTFRVVIASFSFIAVAVFLVLLQPDAGSAAIILGVWFLMVFVSGIPKHYLLAVVGIGILVGVGSWFVLAPYQKERIIGLVRPEHDPLGAGYNVIQSMIAVGSGGFFGKGLGHGSQSQLNFLPERHTDFIFAVIAEESGFVGAVLILFLFFMLLLRMKKIAESAHEHFSYFLVVGIMAMIFLQVLVNVGMNMGMMPVTGIPLPMVSYGGSSLLSMSIALGMVLNVYRRRRRVLSEHVVESY